MEQEKTQAEELYTQGVLESLHSSLADDSAKGERRYKSISLFQQALQFGLSDKDEIQCHMHLGQLFYGIAEDSGQIEIEAIRENGIDQLPYASRSLAELEQALILDFNKGTNILNNPDGGRHLFYLYSTKLEDLWVYQSFHLEKEHGVQSQANYLYEKSRMLDYLGSIYMPKLCFILAWCLGKLNDAEGRDYWLDRCLSADDFSDLGYEGYKKITEDALEYLGDSTRTQPMNLQEGDKVSAAERIRQALSQLENEFPNGRVVESTEEKVRNFKEKYNYKTEVVASFSPDDPKVVDFVKNLAETNGCFIVLNSRTRQYDIYSISHKTSACFIATATYGSILAPEVIIFRRFRDNVLLRSKMGKILVATYYVVSPPFALLISKNHFLKVLTRRILLQPLLGLLKK